MVKIHKRMKSLWIIAHEVRCGIWVQYKQAHYHWSKVNCKNCLKEKNDND